MNQGRANKVPSELLQNIDVIDIFLRDQRLFEKVKRNRMLREESCAYLLANQFEFAKLMAEYSNEQERYDAYAKYLSGEWKNSNMVRKPEQQSHSSASLPVPAASKKKQTEQERLLEKIEKILPELEWTLEYEKTYVVLHSHIDEGEIIFCRSILKTSYLRYRLQVGTYVFEGANENQRFEELFLKILAMQPGSVLERLLRKINVERQWENSSNTQNSKRVSLPSASSPVPAVPEEVQPEERLLRRIEKSFSKLSWTLEYEKTYVVLQSRIGEEKIEFSRSISGHTYLSYRLQIGTDAFEEVNENERFEKLFQRIVAMQSLRTQALLKQRIDAEKKWEEKRERQRRIQLKKEEKRQKELHEIIRRKEERETAYNTPTACHTAAVTKNEVNRKQKDMVPEVPPVKQENKTTKQRAIEEVRQVHGKHQIGIKGFIVRRSVWKCIHAGHKLQPIDAVVKMLDHHDGKEWEETVSAAYCPECKTYFIMEATYQKLKKEGFILCRIIDEKSYQKEIQSGAFSLAQESILMQYGYSVSKGNELGEAERQNLLAALIGNNILTPSEIISYLTFFINQRKGRAEMMDAISKWKKDIDFVSGYRVSEHKKVKVHAIYRKH